MKKSIFEANEREQKKHAILEEANKAKDVLWSVAEKLEESGYIRKADAFRNLVLKIEHLQD